MRAPAYTTTTKTDAEWEEFVDEAIRRAVAFYDESLDKRFGQVLEALDSMKLQVAKIPKMEQDLSELKSDMIVVKLAVRDTNNDLRYMRDNW